MHARALSCPSAAPHSSRGTAVNTGPFGKMSIKRSGLLKKEKKIDILEVQGRENPQMRFQPGLYYLQTCGKYSASSLLIGGELKGKK